MYFVMLMSMILSISFIDNTAISQSRWGLECGLLEQCYTSMVCCINNIGSDSYKFFGSENAFCGANLCFSGCNIGSSRPKIASD